MARKRLEVEKPQNQKESSLLAKLADLIDSHGNIKSEMNDLDKVAKAQNTEIKEIMNAECMEDENGKRVFKGVTYVATLATRDNSKMNEDKLIAYLKEHGLAKGIVKKKEYIDEKAFEEAVFNHKISEEQLVEMDTCKDYSTMQVLTFKKVGGK